MQRGPSTVAHVAASAADTDEAAAPPSTAQAVARRIRLEFHVRRLPRPCPTCDCARVPVSTVPESDGLYDAAPETTPCIHAMLTAYLLLSLGQASNAEGLLPKRKILGAAQRPLQHRAVKSGSPRVDRRGQRCPSRVHGGTATRPSRAATSDAL